MTISRPNRFAVAAVPAGLLLMTAQTFAQVISYQWLPGANSSVISAHSIVGPVLATDFVPATTGSVVQIDWWGSAPQTGGANNDMFEVTFHDDSSPGGTPAVTLPTGGISQHFVFATGVNTGNNVWLYSAAWGPQDVFLTAGTSYWFSVANASGGHLDLGESATRCTGDRKPILQRCRFHRGTSGSSLRPARRSLVCGFSQPEFRQPHLGGTGS